MESASARSHDGISIETRFTARSGLTSVSNLATGEQRPVLGRLLLERVDPGDDRRIGHVLRLDDDLERRRLGRERLLDPVVGLDDGLVLQQ
jgi:hypothetical protein